MGRKNAWARPCPEQGGCCEPCIYRDTPRRGWELHVYDGFFLVSPMNGFNFLTCESAMLINLLSIKCMQLGKKNNACQCQCSISPSLPGKKCHFLSPNYILFEGPGPWRCQVNPILFMDFFFSKATLFSWLKQWEQYDPSHPTFFCRRREGRHWTSSAQLH